MEQVKAKKYPVQIAGKEYNFRTRWEAIYARFLNVLQIGETIESWQYRPEPFSFSNKWENSKDTFQPTFRLTKKTGEIKYLYVNYQVSEAMYDKIKRFLKYYPDYRSKLQIIDKQFFDSNEQKLKQHGLWL